MPRYKQANTERPEFDRTYTEKLSRKIHHKKVTEFRANQHFE